MMNKRNIKKQIRKCKEKDNRVALNKVRGTDYYLSTVYIKTAGYYESALMTFKGKHAGVSAVFPTYKTLSDAKRWHNYYLDMSPKALLELAENY